MNNHLNPTNQSLESLLLEVRDEWKEMSMKMEAKKLKTTIYNVKKELFKPYLIELIANPKITAII